MTNLINKQIKVKDYITYLFKDDDIPLLNCEHKDSGERRNRSQEDSLVMKCKQIDNQIDRQIDRQIDGFQMDS